MEAPFVFGNLATEENFTDWDEVRENPDEVLELAEKIAVEKNIKIVICVDEFQLFEYLDEVAL